MITEKRIYLSHMIRAGVKIFYYFVLLVTGIALIGINVRLLHCCHAKDSVVEVKIIPDEEEEPCSDSCCGMRQCHTHTHHTFFKITDFSQVEPNFQIYHIICIIPFIDESLPFAYNYMRQLILSCGIEFLIEPPSCSLLCTYIC